MRLKVGVLPFGGWSRLFAAAALAWWTVAINGEQAGNPQGARPTLIKKAHDNEPVRGLAFSSDGRYLITMGNGTGKRWQQTLPGGQGVVEGSRIVEVKIWETPRGNLVRTIESQRGSLEGWIVDEAHGLLATGSDLEVVNLWEIPSGRVAGAFAGTRPMGFTADGTSLWVQLHRSFSVVNGRPVFQPFDAWSAYDVRTGRLVAPSEPTLLSSDGILRTGAWMFLSSRAQVAAILFPDRVEIRDPVTGQVLRRLATSFSFFSGRAALSADGSRFALARGSKEEIAVEVWNVATGERLWNEVAERPVADRELLVRESAGTSMSLDSFKVPELLFSPDSQTLVGWHQWGDYDSALRVWDVTTGRGKTIIRSERDKEMQLRDVAFTPDGSALAISRSSELRSFSDAGRSRPRGKPTGTVTLAKLSTLEVFVEFAQESDILEVALSPDVSMLATGDANGDVRIWRVPR